ncbi:hypothetical protein HMPREF0262_03040 [Clostridium sp. ATCC 29733]|nr:hypothetical protein HMPREF0262_03040 [Clostridium sp. ATCC 29733]
MAICLAAIWRSRAFSLENLCIFPPPSAGAAEKGPPLLAPCIQEAKVLKYSKYTKKILFAFSNNQEVPSCWKRST